jgi:hypothetical protein
MTILTAILAYLKARAAEPTSRNALIAALGSFGGSAAVGMPVTQAAYIALGVGLTAAVGTPERTNGALPPAG